MNKLSITVIALATSFAFSTGVMAQRSPQNQADSIEKPTTRITSPNTGPSSARAMARESARAKRTISADYKTDRAACNPMTGSAKTSCRADARAKMVSARASLTPPPAAKEQTGRRDQAADARANEKRGPIESPKL